MRARKGKELQKKNKPLVYDRSGIVVSNLLFRAGVFFLIVNLMLLSLGTTALFTNAKENSQESNNDLGIKEQIHSETYIDNIADTLTIGPFSKETVIRINYTVLPQSNSSVDFVFHYAYLDYTTWLPVPLNFTLTVGESFSGDFTLNRTINQPTLSFGFDAHVVIGGTNATVHWWYEVLVTGKTPAAGYIVVSGTLFLLSLGVAIHSKSKVLGEKQT